MPSFKARAPANRRPDTGRAARLTAVLSLLALLPIVGGAAEDTGLWATGAIHHALDERWSASLVLQPRFNDDIGTLERLVIRPWLTRKLGAGHSVTLGYDAHVIESPRDRIEHRTWEQWGWRPPGAFANLFMRVRLEQRFIEDVDGTALRLRLEGRWTKPLGDGPWRFILSNEVFFGLNDVNGGPRDGYDQNRAYAGFRRSLRPRLSGSLGYQMQHIDRRGDDLTIHQIMVGLTFR